MPRNLLYFSAIASLMAFIPAASAADYAVEPMPEAGLAVGVEQETVAVQEDDSLIDIDIDLGLFDDDDEDRVVAMAETVPEPEPLPEAEPLPEGEPLISK
ncbi:MAG TPA: hypothetical protein VD768_06705 [Sphingomicrobium sp.]|nr:hypothetical protein [Sphingomicrobium sp.]